MSRVGEVHIEHNPDALCECGYPPVVMNCSEPFSLWGPTAKFDYWYYCSNKGCKHHEGRGVNSGGPWHGGKWWEG